MENKPSVELTIKEPPFMDIQMKNSFQYPHEAFALMEYGCEECGKVEIIWNSRDGVTPFMVGCPFCRGTMQHINWSHDRFTPNYIPPIGSRVFFSCTNIHEVIQEVFDNYTEEVWERIKKNWGKYYTDRYELIWKIAQGNIVEDLRFEHPHIAIITENNQERFMSRYAKISKRLEEITKGNALLASWIGIAFKSFTAYFLKHDIMDDIIEEIEKNKEQWKEQWKNIAAKELLGKDDGNDQE
ncbi:MAG: hypothetical protein PVG39_00500 [Desulfobacteraceae bacterium]|jgi:hypothetical protein